MLWVYGMPIICFLIILVRGSSLYSDVYIRQILPSKHGPCTERVNPLTSRPECMPGSRYTGVGVLLFRHLKLELLTQFPASNDEKYINVVYS